jgi:aryl-alcohol dehydrogenase-like predicted oxidoreductase
MQYQTFGRSGIRVSQIALGAMRFGAPAGRGLDAAASRQVFDAYADAGGNFIDTAGVYNAGASERTLADLIARDRDHFVVASKYGMAGDGQDLVGAGGSRKAMAASVENSLKRLGTDRLDILYLHRWDFATAIDDVMRSADDLVRQGKIMAFALSNTPAWIVARAATIAELRGWANLAGVQVQYHPLDRSAERELLPMAHDLGLGFVAWSPLARGVLAQADGETPLHDVLRHVAAAYGARPVQVALAWFRDRLGHPVIPAIGLESVSQVADALASTSLSLSPEQLSLLDAAAPLDLGQPYGELADPIYDKLATGFRPDLLRDAHGRKALR